MCFLKKEINSTASYNGHLSLFITKMHVFNTTNDQWGLGKGIIRRGGGGERSGLFDGVDKKGQIKYIKITSSI